jgi:glycosyltransferase involved in cell wall biosynthesis
LKHRLVLITEIIAPYRIPVFNQLATRDDIDLHVLFLSETDPSLRQWLVHKEEIRFPYEVLPVFRRRVGKYNLLINRGMVPALQRADPQAVLCGGYNYLASWQAAYWATRQNIPLLLWIESTGADIRQNNPVVEWMKRRFLHMCRGFVVPGMSSKAYLKQFAIPETRIFTAPNATDLRFLMEAARKARLDSAAIRSRFGLPQRYFLNVGRFVREKGVFDLLEAYGNLDAGIRSAVGLVFVGDGASRAELAAHAARISPGTIHFAGFVQKDQLPSFYALADALVFPTHSDPWGFVVNEAMACGLPVIATDVAGCVADLVLDGWNGHVVPAGDVARLTSAMDRITKEDDLRLRMAQRSAEHILRYSPEACAGGIAEAVVAACDGPSAPRSN